MYACPDLDAICRWVGEQTGAPPAPGGQHPSFGTRNALLSLGARTYLELIGPDAEQPAPEQPRPFGTDWLRSPSLRGWAAASDDIARAIQVAQRYGHQLGPLGEGRRRTPEGTELSWRMARAQPAGAGGPDVFPFLIDWGESPHPATTSPGGLALERFVLLTPAPGVAKELLAALGLEGPWEVVPSPGPALRAEMVGRGGERVVLAS